MNYVDVKFENPNIKFLFNSCKQIAMRVERIIHIKTQKFFLILNRTETVMCHNDGSIFFNLINTMPNLIISTLSIFLSKCLVNILLLLTDTTPNFIKIDIKNKNCCQITFTVMTNFALTVLYQLFKHWRFCLSFLKSLRKSESFVHCRAIKN